jgi:uncharacterized membrane protein YidH (DUF202 family)
MSEIGPRKKFNYLVLGLGWLGGILIVLGATRWVTGVWSAEAAEFAGPAITLTSIILIAVGVVLVIVWATLRSH